MGAVVRGASPDCVSVVGKIGCRCPLAVCRLGTIVIEVSIGDTSGRTVYGCSRMTSCPCERCHRARTGSHSTRPPSRTRWCRRTAADSGTRSTGAWRWATGMPRSRVSGVGPKVRFPGSRANDTACRAVHHRCVGVGRAGSPTCEAAPHRRGAHPRVDPETRSACGAWHRPHPLGDGVAPGRAVAGVVLGGDHP